MYLPDYHEVIIGFSPYNYRLRMVQFAMKYSIAKAARDFRTTRKTVRLWLQRYQKEGTKGLKDHSRAPKHIPHKIPKILEDRIVELRKQYKAFGARRLKGYFNLPCSTWTINRVLKQHGMIKPHRKKYQKKRDLARLKRKLKAITYNQLDVKYLDDLVDYYPQMVSHNLPRFQYTWRDVKTGALFIGFADEKTETNAVLFLQYVGQHLKKYGIDFREVVIQTDNGPEFSGGWNRKEPGEFTVVVEERFRARHRFIPPGQSTYNSDVETSHRLIEDEFYEVETFQDRGDLLAKAYAYQIFFNLKRRNSHKGDKTPYEIAIGDRPDVPVDLFLLPPVIIDDLLNQVRIPINQKAKGGYHLPDLPTIRTGS